MKEVLVSECDCHNRGLIKKIIGKIIAELLENKVHQVK